jgi:hypothetical protein
MSSAYLNYRRFTLDEQREPQWKDKVSRWSQLDGPAFALAEFYWVNKSNLSKPSMLLLASPGASNNTDRRFVLAESVSPSLFVHTLPNIRCSPLFQVMEWSGSVICIQNDPHTILAGLREALGFVSESRPVVWVVGVTSEKQKHTVHCFEVSATKKGTYRIDSDSSIRPTKLSDADLLRWLETPEQQFKWSETVIHREK